MAGSKSMELSRELAQMDAEELRDLTATLLADVLEVAIERSPTQPASRLEELLPHRWQSISAKRSAS